MGSCNFSGKEKKNGIDKIDREKVGGVCKSASSEKNAFSKTDISNNLMNRG